MADQDRTAPNSGPENYPAPPAPDEPDRGLGRAAEIVADTLLDHWLSERRKRRAASAQEARETDGET